jgi:hypothetical protein
VLEVLSQIGELVGGLGALIALVYLARQIQQSNVIVRAQSRQTLLDTASAGDWDLARDTELLEAFGAALDRWPDISDEHRTKFTLGMTRYLANIQNGLQLHEAGLVDAALVRQMGNNMATCALAPGGARWWAAAERIIQPDVYAYVERLRAEMEDEGPGGLLDEVLPFWIRMGRDAVSSGD